MTSKKNLSEKQNFSIQADQAFHLMFESHAAIMLLIEPNTGVIFDANPAAINFYGYPKAILCGMPIDEINTLTPDQVAAARQKAINREQNFFIFTHRLASGEERRVEVHSSPFTLQGKPVLLSIIHEANAQEPVNKDLSQANIPFQETTLQYEASLENLRIYQVELEMQNTELRRSQGLIELMQARYFDLYDLAPVGYCTISETGLILEANLTAASQVGVIRAELINKPLHRLIMKEYQDSFYLFRKKLFATGKTQTCELQMTNKNNLTGVMWVLLKATLAHSAKGDPEARLTISDISESKLSEAAKLEREVSKREQAVQAKADEERRILLDNIQTQVWYLTDHHTYGAVNVAHAAFIGVQKEILASRSLSDFIPIDMLKQYLQDVQDAFATGQSMRSEIWLPDADGNRRLLSILTAPILNSGGTVRQVICSAEDITERKQAEEALLQSEQRYRAVVEWSPSAIIVHRDKKVIYVNPAAIKFFGASSAQELVGSLIYDRIHPDSHQEVRKRLKKAADDGAGAPLTELQYLRMDGTVVDAEVQGIPILFDGLPAIYAVLADISVRKASDEKIRLLNIELENLALTDFLTNLPNRRYFMQRGTDEINRVRRNSQPITLLMMDIDWFKLVNDTYGHEAGDLALQQVAAILKSGLREIDIFGRLGGDEFVVLLPDTSLEDGILMAERLRKSIADTPLEISGQVLRITVSIGAAAFTDEMTTIDSLIGNADEAMYHAKNSGRNCVKVYQQGAPPPPRKGASGIGWSVKKVEERNCHVVSY